MSTEHCIDATGDLTRAERQWRDLMGGLFTGAGSPLDAPVHHQCSEVYGFGRCEADFSDAQKAVWNQFHKEITAASRLPRALVYDGWKKLTLLSVVRPERAAAAADMPPPRETREI